MREDPPTVETLLAHQDFVRALARGLLGREDRAEDVVQETWLAAVENPPRHAASPRGWLARVARNAAWRLLQREARRPRVEARAHRTASGARAPTPDEVLRREEIRRRVVSALLGLPDNDREVLLLRYYEDRPPREVARRLGLPVETVRTRIRRALARLRNALEEDPGPAWRGWAVASLGALTMKKILATTLAAALVLLAGWWVASETGLLGRGESKSEDAARVVGPGGVPRDGAKQEPRLAGVAAGGSLASRRARYGVVRGRVVDLEGRGIENARVWIGSTREPRWVADLYAGSFHVRCDVEGRFQFAPQAPANRVHATADGYAGSATWWLGGDVPVELVLRRTDVVVRGTIRDLAGRPVEGALVYVFSPYGRQPGTHGSTDAAGRYEVPFVSGRESYVGAWAQGFLELEARIPHLTRDEPATVDLVLRPGYVIEGRVTDAVTGEGVGGALLTTWERFGPIWRTDAEGRFRYLATREVNEITASAEGYGDGKAPLRLEGRVARADVVLAPLTSSAFEGVVFDADGEPVVDARVHTPGSALVSTDDEGRFRLRVWSPSEAGPAALIAEAGDAAPAIALSPRADEPITLRLGPPTVLRGRVELSDGEPASGSSLKLGWPGDHDVPADVLRSLACATPRLVAPDGTFRIGGLPPGEVEVDANPSRHANALAASAHATVPTETEVVITLPAGNVLYGRVVDTEGRGVAFADLSFFGGVRRPSVTADAEGRFRVPGFAAGHLKLHVKAPGYRFWHRKLTIVNEPLEVALERAPWLCFRLKGEVPPTGTSVWVSHREPGSTRGRAGGAANVLDGVVWHQIHHWTDEREYVIQGDGWTTRPVVVPKPTGEDDVVVDVEMVPVAAAEPSPPEAPSAEPPVATGSIEGRVRGTPDELVDAQVWAIRLEGEGPPTKGRPDRSALVQPDGAFLLEDVPVGSWALHVHRVYSRGDAVRVEVEPDRTTAVDDLVAPELGPSIRGVMRDDSEAPVAGQLILATSRRLKVRSGWGRTGPDGTFEIRDLTHGEDYRLKAVWGDRGRAVEQVVRAGRDDVVLRLVRHGTVRGFLEGPWGAEVPSGGRVHFQSTGPEGFRNLARLQTGGRELYFERRLPPGEYLVSAEIGDYVTTSMTKVTVRSGEVSPRLDLVLDRGATVEVRLVDADGEPQPGTRLGLPPSWARNSFLGLREEGIYVVRAVPPGEWTFEARGPAGRGRGTVSVAAGESVTLEIVLRR